MKSSKSIMLLALLSISTLYANDVELTSSVDDNVKVGDIYTREHTIVNNTSSVLTDIVFNMENQEPYNISSSSLLSNESLTIKDVKFAKSAGNRDENYNLSAISYDLNNKSVVFSDDFNTTSDWGSYCTISNGVATTSYNENIGSGVCSRSVDIVEDKVYAIVLKAKRSGEDVPKKAVVTLQYKNSNNEALSKVYKKEIEATNSLDEMTLYIPKAPQNSAKLDINIYTALNSEVTIDDVEIDSFDVVSQSNISKSSNLTYTIEQNNDARTTTASLGDLVWYDEDVDGIQDYSEQGIAGIRVHLYKDGQDTGEVNYTDSNGMYLFENLEADHNYSIKVDLPTNYKDFTLQNKGGDESLDSDTDGYGYTDSVFLRAGDNYRDLDCGMVCRCVAWIDIEKYTVDRDGNLVDADRDSGPTLIVGQEVTWKYVITNSSRVRVNNIKVVDDIEGDINCTQNYLDSNDTMTCTKTGIVQEGNYSNMATVTGRAENNQDVADEDPSHYYGKKPSCIGDLIWLDENKNGIQDNNESGIEGAKVELLDENGNSVEDLDGNSVEPIVTTSSGEYKFCNLDEGKYIIKVTPPSGYEISPKDEGNDDTKDSDIDKATGKSDVITLDEGENNMDIDGGLNRVKKPSCIGDLIWLDENKNGIQDNNESGIEGAKVELLDENGNSVEDLDGNSVEPIVTTSSGEYKFCNLDEGKYIIKVTPPSGYEISPKDEGNDDTKDSDIDKTTGKSDVITLDEGEEDMSWDGGVTPSANIGGEDKKNACLGNYMWLDENLNGIQDNNELGVVNIKVELYDAVTNELIATTQTDSDGKYLFCNLKAGKYKVKFEQPNTYLFTYKDKGDDTTDSDVDESGWSGVVELSSGEKDLTVDAGVYCECDDYKVNPQNYKKVSASVSFNGALALLLFVLFSTFKLNYKRD